MEIADTNGEIAEAYAYDTYGNVDVYTATRASCTGHGDTDGDCDVDMDDFLMFAACYSTSSPPPACTSNALAALDANSDGKITLADYAAFVDGYTGALSSLHGDGDFNTNGQIDEADCAAFAEICYSGDGGDGGGINTTGCEVFDFDGDQDVDIHDYATLAELKDTQNQATEIQLIKVDASTINPYFFTGRRLDSIDHGAATPKQLYHFRARNYNGDRFLQREPLGYVDGLILYSYVRSRPTRWVDPFGNQATQPATEPDTPDSDEADKKKDPAGTEGGPGLGTGQNCLGRACGRPEWIDWPNPLNSGDRVTTSGLADAVQTMSTFVPKGCRSVSSGEECRCCILLLEREDLELIVWFWTYRSGGAGGPAFHAIGRNPCKEDSVFQTKNAGGNVWDDITDPQNTFVD